VEDNFLILWVLPVKEGQTCDWWLNESGAYRFAPHRRLQEIGGNERERDEGKETER
jgi:hypothetical protein